MARVPYRDLGEVDQALIDRIVRERGSVLHLYQILLHSEPLTQGWLAFFTAVRQQLKVSPRLRELIIIQIAHLNDAEYEASQHVPIALAAGATQDEIKALLAFDSGDVFSAREKAIFAYAREMTRNVKVDPGTFDTMRSHYSEKEIVELTGLIAAYNMASRFLEALQIHSHDERKA